MPVESYTIKQLINDLHNTAAENQDESMENCIRELSHSLAQKLDNKDKENNDDTRNS